MQTHLRFLTTFFGILYILFFVSCKTEIDSPENDQTVYFTVTFNSNGGTSIDSQTVASGNTVSIPSAPIKVSTITTNYSFIGWYTDEKFLTAYDFTSTITSNLTLYAKWAENAITYTVSFNSNGGTSIDSQTVVSGNTASIPSVPTKESTDSTTYTFAGWYTDEELQTAYDFTNAITTNLELYAKWAENAITHTVTFYSNDGTNIDAQIIANGNTAIEPSAPIKEGYTFCGWYINVNDNIKFDFSTPIKENIILYATYTLTNYQITFAGIENAVNPNLIETYTIENDNIVLKNASKNGYIFLGWFYLDEKITQISPTLKTNLTITAKWAKLLDDFVSIAISKSQNIYVCVHEVTQEEYKNITGLNPSNFTESFGNENINKRPVENISWTESLIYCNRRSLSEGFSPYYIINGSKNPDNWGSAPGSFSNDWTISYDNRADGYRLLTQTEWLYIAKVDSYSYSGSNTIDDVAWYSDNSDSVTHQVCLKKPNSFGIYDLTGNVRELIFDWSGSYSLISTSETFAMVENRSALGGSFVSSENSSVLEEYEDLLQNSVPQGRKSEYTGFRVCRTLQ